MNNREQTQQEILQTFHQFEEEALLNPELLSSIEILNDYQNAMYIYEELRAILYPPPVFTYSNGKGE